ncbi:hypothetical protein ACOMHN_022319 [Nucella lapillus]
MIDRSHRVGRQPSVGEAQNRPIQVKFCSYRYKSMLMGARKKLANLDLKRLVADADWPALSQAARSSGSRSDRQNTLPRVYINHDLTRERAEIAWTARALKRKKKIDDTWIYMMVLYL